MKSHIFKCGFCIYKKYLFYLELIALAGEARVALKGGLKKYARETIAQSDEAVRKAHPEVFKHLDDLIRKTFESLDDAYRVRYLGRSLQELVGELEAFKKFGDAGKQTVRQVNIKVNDLIGSLSKNSLKKHVMVSGMTYTKNGRALNTFTFHNFVRKVDGVDEIGKLSETSGRYLDDTGNITIYQKFLDDMHPTLKERYIKHLEEVRKGLNASLEDIERAGVIASHGEIRALDALLKKVDPLGTIGDEIFKDIIGYNRFLRFGANKVQPPCVHCHYLTTFVKYIGI